MKKLTKISGKVFSKDENGNLVEHSYEEVLHDWLNARKGTWFDTKTIAEALNMPYDTIQPKLKWMATNEKDCPSDLRIEMSKKARALGQIGRRRYLWKVE